jgi:predicted PurR-regulated permease PerM
MTKHAHFQASLPPFARRVLAVIGILLPSILVAYFLWSVGQGILVIFAGILFAVLLDGVTRIIRSFTPLKRHIALPIAILIVALLAFGGGWLGGSRIAAQAPLLSKQLRQSIDHIHDRLVGSRPTPNSATETQRHQSSSSEKVLSYGKQLIGSVAEIASVSVDTAANVLIIIILGIYFAISPGYYLEISAMLIPPRERAHVIQVLDTIGHALRRWFLGQILAMILVGVLTTAGLYALGVKLSFILGIIAGLFTFVPYLGVLISAAPAILVGLSNGPLMAVYVALLFLVVHIIEGYVFTPLVQRRIVHLAPAFLLVAQLLAGLFAGIFGIFVAAPFAIAFTIGVQKFYLEGMLAESPHILGDDTMSEAGQEAATASKKTDTG